MDSPEMKRRAQILRKAGLRTDAEIAPDVEAAREELGRVTARMAEGDVTVAPAAAALTIRMAGLERELMAMIATIREAEVN